MRWQRWYVAAVGLLAGLGLAVAGIWCLVAPRSFAGAVDFPYRAEYTEHFLHDLGAFQLGAAATLLIALIWADGPAVALAGLLTGTTIHAANHAADLDLGGTTGQAWALAAASVAIAAALVLRLRALGYVVGSVRPASTAELAPFVGQKTVLLTTYRRDGRPGATPVSIAVDGDRAYVRSFEKSVKTRRLRRDPRVAVAPSTGRGRPTGPALRARTRELAGDEARHAARLLARKHPLLHRVLVPLTHRLGRAKLGRTVHFELVPDAAAGRTG